MTTKGETVVIQDIGNPQQLLDRARALSESGGRRLLGIVGPPGAGKSTLAEQLVDGLGGRAVSVPMDGFHLAEQELRRLGRTRRKGAPDTFDPLGYAALLGRLREQRPSTVVYAPAFDRALEEPVAGSIPVAADVPLVVTEGNYLLLDEEPWPGVRQLLDEVWYVQLDDVERVRRLVDRHERFGKSRKAAERWVQDSDEANARRVAASRHRSDLIVSPPADPPPADPLPADPLPRGGVEEGDSRQPDDQRSDVGRQRDQPAGQRPQRGGDPE